VIKAIHATRRWEKEPVAEGVTIKDFDEVGIRMTLENAIQREK